MAGNFFWGKESFNPGSDVENPSVFIDNVASPTNNHNTPAANAPGEGISRSPSKAVKLGLVIAALSVAIVLGMVLGRNGSSRNNGVSTSASSQTSIAQQSHAIEISDAIFSPGATGNTPTVQAVVESEPDNVKLITTEYYTSAGPLKARVRMASPSILNGYETCADLESDIAEALKLYMNEFIMNEAEVNEIDAICDTGNDSWHSDLYGFDFDYNDHQLQGELHFCIASRCSPVSSNCKRLKLHMKMGPMPPVLPTATILFVPLTTPRYHGQSPGLSWVMLRVKFFTTRLKQELLMTTSILLGPSVCTIL